MPYSTMDLNGWTESVKAQRATVQTLYILTKTAAKNLASTRHFINQFLIFTPLHVPTRLSANPKSDC